MASYQAISVIALALKGLLAGAAPRSETQHPDVQIFRAGQLQNPPDLNGVSIYLHRVAFNLARRNLPPRQDPDGKRFRPPTPVDAHFLFTAWAKRPEVQLEHIGWAVRALQDAAILPAGFLNSFAGGSREVFRPEETIELVGEILTAQDFVNIFGSASASQQPSVSYMARMICIDSEIELTDAGLVQTRVFKAAKMI